VVAQSLRGGCPTQHPIFNDTIQWTEASSEFYLYAQYESHDDATLSYMEDALCLFHTLKDVFLLGRDGTNVMATANALRTYLVKKRKVDKERNTETGMPSKKQHKMNAWQDYISHKWMIPKSWMPT
jgi:hypothetical protein